MKHLVVVMMENRSFDHILGWLKEENNDIDGALPNDWKNRNAVGEAIPLAQDATVQGQFKVDPGHYFENVFLQMYGTPFLGQPATMDPDMTGFVRSYEQLAGSHKGPAVMQCFPPEKVPVVAALARSYLVCDRWFSSVPGPTLPNRAFAHFGTSFGRVDMSPDYALFSKPSIYQRLADEGKRGKIYYYAKWSGTLGMSFLLKKQSAFFGLLGDFEKDCKENRLPEYSFVEPAYADHGNILATDQHPDHNVTAGDQFIKKIYNAIRSNDDTWKTTVLVVVWDEHGGIFDHVPPPAVEPEDGVSSQAPLFHFERLGPRVPAIIVSPFVEAGSVDHTIYEHASIPATVTAQWLGDPATLSPFQREKKAQRFDSVLRDMSPRLDTPDFAPSRKPSKTANRGKDDISELLEIHLRDIHSALMKVNPTLAKQMNPETPMKERDAQRFIAKALKVLHPEEA